MNITDEDVRGHRTRAAIDARKWAITELGLGQHASFVDVATAVIRDRRLYADIPTSRKQAIEFLGRFWVLRKFGGEPRGLSAQDFHRLVELRQ